MIAKGSGDYLTHGQWLRDVFGNEEVVLKGDTALLYLDIFEGFSDEDAITVYAKTPGKYTNVTYVLVPNFDNIDYQDIRGIRCSTPSQAFNDLLDDCQGAGDQVLTEGLADYYFENDKSFEGLSIKPEHTAVFERVKQHAVTFYQY